MTYNVLVNYETYAEGIDEKGLAFELANLTLSECVDFLPDEERYTIRIEYIENGEVVDWEDTIEYTEEDIITLQEEEYENELFHQWHDLVTW